MRPHYVCGECCSILERAGCRQQTSAVITLGTACERHTRSAATRIVFAPEGALPPLEAPPDVPTRDELPAADDDDDGEGAEAVPLAVVVDPASLPRRASFGPVTELAARFVASWSHKSEGAKGDDFMVAHAVKVARALLRETGGR